MNGQSPEEPRSDAAPGAPARDSEPDANRDLGENRERPAAETPAEAAPVEEAPAEEPVLYMDRYQLGTVLGRGGTCTVFRAWDTRLQRHVAIKRLEPVLVEDPHARARFNREGRAIARLSHPHLVTLIDRGSTDDEEYLVFEYVEGRSLKEVMQESGPLSAKDACHIVGQVAEGLAQAHLAGIVHRDVKPQNILLDAEGRAKLTDFGIATGADLTRVTRAGAIIGSGRYMSPEQVQSRPVDARSDLYSLGIVFYEMLSGEPPFAGQSIVDIGRQHVREQPRPLDEVRPDLPPSLTRVVMRCLEKLPENRFQSMEELLGALVGLDTYSLERTSGGLVESLKRVGRSRLDPSGDSAEWTPPPDRIEPPPERPLTPTGPAPAPSRVELRRSERQRRERRTRNRTTVLAALLIGAAVILALAWLLFSGNPQAPDVVGLSLEEARDAAGQAGLEIQVLENQVPSLDDTNAVVSQTPDPGVEADDGVLSVTISRPATPVGTTEVQDLDPEGDQSERPEELGNLTDGDPATAWTSEGYGTANFGNTGKSGIGLLFRLDGEARLVRILAESQGWTATLQVPTGGGAWEPAADLSGAGEQTVTLEQPVSEARIWITALPEQVGTDNFHRAVIDEVTFYN